ncbi:MAG TPA: diguanylate cyclase [Pyrinomonadaceae bacterium]
MLDRLAEDNGVAVVVLDENSREVSVSNNNSICRALTSSPIFAPRCAEYCGVAFRNTESGEEFEYRCYAGLTCRAVPVADRGKRFVAIVGRTFTTADDYRQATEKAISGEWREFQANEFFENVLLDGVSGINKAITELSKYRVTEKKSKVIPAPSPPPSPKQQTTTRIDQQIPAPKSGADVRSSSETHPSGEHPQRPAPAKDRPIDEARALRSLYERLGKLDYETACGGLLEFLRTSYGLDSLVWFERKDDHFEIVAATGGLRGAPIRVGIAADNARLLDAWRRRLPLELRERIADRSLGYGRTLSLFASIVGGEMRGAIGVEGRVSAETSTEIMRFCRRIGPQLEILRLNREIASREWLSRATSRFTESLKRIDAEDFWTHVTQVSAELVQSERASLLVRKEQSEGLYAKAAIGAKVDLFVEPGIGRRVAQSVLQAGKPIVVGDITRTRMSSAPEEWRYKTSSFISYPLLIGERRLAVMNFTDKATGSAFEERDLELLDAIAPHIAVAIDRTSLKDMAGEFEQLSVTDALTGLLNRRYLEKRLSEEIQRSKRHRFPMTLMLLDVDDFKSYNDSFGHPAGDAALKIVAGVLQDILRGADVAARYGGEEFAILLPQTTSSEAAAIAERLRQRIEHADFPKRKVTVSIGIASCSNDIETPDDLVAAADHALYEAKDHGRNNVQIYDGYGKSFNDKIN